MGRRAARELTEKDVENMKQDLANGIAITKISKINGIGFYRMLDLLGIEYTKRKADNNNGETQKESIAREKNILAKKQWDKFKIGKQIHFDMKINNKEKLENQLQEIKGEIKNKTPHCIIIFDGKRNNTVTFADVISKMVVVRHRIEQNKGKFQKKHENGKIYMKK